MNRIITQWSPVALHHLYCFLKTPLGLNFTLCCKWTWLLWEEIKTPFALVYFSPPDKTSDPETMILGVDSGTLLSEWHPCFRRGVLWRSQVSLACLSHCGTPSPPHDMCSGPQYSQQCYALSHQQEPLSHQQGWAEEGIPHLSVALH